MGDWLHPLFEERLRARRWSGARVLDIGTGRGNPALLLASLGASVVGVDVDAEALAAARAEASGVGNVFFLEADAESLDLRRSFPSLTAVTAHLCVSERIVRLAAAALPKGGRLLLCAHHADHWRESGKKPRFAVTAEEVGAWLEAASLRPELLQVSTRTRASPGVEALAAELGAPRVARWREDGRWRTLEAAFAAGRRELTESHVIADAVR
jgi:SAM-dependent methyltransferase